MNAKGRLLNIGYFVWTKGTLFRSFQRNRMPLLHKKNLHKSQAVGMRSRTLLKLKITALDVTKQKNQIQLKVFLISRNANWLTFSRKKKKDNIILTKQKLQDFQLYWEIIKRNNALKLNQLNKIYRFCSVFFYNV